MSENIFLEDALEKWHKAEAELAQARQQIEELNRKLARRWNDPSRQLVEQAKEFLRQSGIRDVVLRHEGQPNEQSFSYAMAFFAANLVEQQLAEARAQGMREAAEVAAKYAPYSKVASVIRRAAEEKK